MIPIETSTLGELDMFFPPVSIMMMGKLEESSLVSCAEACIWRFPMKKNRSNSLPSRFFIGLNLVECFKWYK
jgi:hypothetical protein